MESKNESIQLARICITTTFHVGEKSIFFQKSLQGRFPTRLFLYCTHMSIAKPLKNPEKCRSYPGLAVRHMCPPYTPMISADAKYISWLLRQLFFDLHLLLNGLSNKCQIFVVFAIEQKQGWIHGRTVPDSWAGAVMQKPLAIQ